MKNINTFHLDNESNINDIRDLYTFITQELAFNKVMYLYKLLKNKIEGEEDANNK